MIPSVLPSVLPPSDSKPESLEAHKIKTAFFTHPTLTEIGRRLVSHYFLLTEEELTMWEEDPESFGNNTPLLDTRHVLNPNNHTYLTRQIGQEVHYSAGQTVTESAVSLLLLNGGWRKLNNGELVFSRTSDILKMLVLLSKVVY